MVAACAGAIVGDSLGYWVGKRYGARAVKGRLGRLIGERRWERARRHLRRKGFATILVGRFPPAIRSLVPMVAGMARVPYRQFLLGNVIGGVLWAGGSAALGYFAADAWRKIDAVHTWVGVGMGVLVVAAGVWLLVRRRRKLRPEVRPRATDAETAA